MYCRACGAMETHQTTDLGIAGSIPAGLVFFTLETRRKKETNKQTKGMERGKCPKYNVRVLKLNIRPRYNIQCCKGL